MFINRSLGTCTASNSQTFSQIHFRLRAFYFFCSTFNTLSSDTKLDHFLRLENFNDRRILRGYQQPCNNFLMRLQSQSLNVYKKKKKKKFDFIKNGRTLENLTSNFTVYSRWLKGDINMQRFFICFKKVPQVTLTLKIYLKIITVANCFPAVMIVANCWKSLRDSYNSREHIRMQTLHYI